MVEEISRHTHIEASNARWICIDSIYEKFNLPNFYDIGGTYLANANSEYWFLCQTDNFGDKFLLHIFVQNYVNSPFKLGLSFNSNIVADRNGIMYLPKSLAEFEFMNVPENKVNYITTYEFSFIDVERFKGKQLYIHFKLLNNDSMGFCCELVNEVKTIHDLGSLLTDPVCSDFAIESADGHVFKVHKIIISTQSEVFKAMLKENTAESKNNLVKLIDVNKIDLENILQFVYTGSVKATTKGSYSNLLLLADKYDLKELFELAQYLLCEQLAHNTVLDILVIADMCNSYFLKTAAMKFIKQNPSVMKDDSWKQFKKSDLLKEILEFVM